MPKSFNYIFVDESGDPEKLYKTDKNGNKVPTGASLFYILSAVCLNSEKLFALENRIIEVKNKYKFRGELKAQIIPLTLYKDLLNLINESEVRVYYRLVNKATYKGTFIVDGKPHLHNIFDEYNLVKLVIFSIKKCSYEKVEVIIDRADRRLLDGKYVNVMQISDLISGAIKDDFTKKNPSLKRVINKRLYRVI